MERLSLLIPKDPLWSVVRLKLTYDYVRNTGEGRGGFLFQNRGPNGAKGAAIQYINGL
jgi:hypothetical protein